MAKKMKAYLPKWIRWIMLPVMALVWGLITYLTFATPSGEEGLGTGGWLIFSAVIVLVGVMLWLMTSGRLPAYEIEIEDPDQPRSS